MDYRTALARLRDVLANLYSTEPHAKLIAYDAGLDTSRIAFEPSARVNWHAIFIEAEKVNRVEKIVNIALEDYGENLELQEAWGEYQRSREKKVKTGDTEGRDVRQTNIYGNAETDGDFVGGDKKFQGDEIHGNKYVFQIPDAAVTPAPTETPLPFPPASEDEILIVISQFHVTTGNRDTDIYNEIRRAIKQAADELEVSNLRVEIEPMILPADERQKAEVLGERYKASMVIWGADTGVRVTVNFLNLREPSFEAADVRITEKERTQIASSINPEPYIRFVTEDLPSQLTFLALFAVGQSYYLEEKYTSALTVIEKAVGSLDLQTKPVNGLAEAYFRLGWLYQVPTENLNPEKAINSYNQAIRIDPSLAKAYGNRGNVYSALSQYDAAITDFEEVIKINPNDAFAYNNLGNVYFIQGEYDQAIDNFTTAIDLDPNFALAHYGRGRAYNYQKKYNAAVADFEEVIKINPKDAFAYNNLGNVYLNQGQYNQAIDNFTTAIDLDPNFADSYNNRGWIHYLQKNYEFAMADYNKALDHDPNFADAYNNRGILYNNQGEYEKAIANFTKAIKWNFARLSWPYNNRGSAYADQGEYELAIADYTQAIVLDPNFADAYIKRGTAYHQQGKYTQAIADLSRAIEINPNNARAYNMRGQAYDKIREIDKAIADYQQGMEIGGLSEPLRQYAEYRLHQLE